MGHRTFVVLQCILALLLLPACTSSPPRALSSIAPSYATLPNGSAPLNPTQVSPIYAEVTAIPGDNFVRYGNSGIVPARAPEPVTDRSDVGVAQGFLEESNVNPVLEMTRLIMVQRAFENTAALIRQTEDLLEMGGKPEDVADTLAVMWYRAIYLEDPPLERLRPASRRLNGPCG